MPDSIYDRDLRTRKFLIAEPEKLCDLLQYIPADAGMPDIEFTYNVAPANSDSRDFVYCAHCGHPTHYRGYVVKWSSGCRCLVGKDCGTKHYGADFHQVEVRFRAERRRQIHLLRFDTLLGALPYVLRAIAETSNHPAITQFDHLRQQMRSQAPDLWSALTAAASTGELAIEEMVRDIAAEERRAERRRDPIEDARGRPVRRPEDHNNRPIYTAVRRVLGRFGGPLFFSRLSDALPVFRTEHERLKGEYQRLCRLDTQTLTTPKLKAVVDAVIDAVDALAVYEAGISALPAFFEPANLVCVVKWANQVLVRQAHVKVKGRRLVFTPANRNVSIGFEAPIDYIVPDGFTVLRSFKARIAES